MDSVRVGSVVRLLIDSPPFKKGAVCKVKSVMTFGGREGPDDVCLLECDGKRTTAQRKELEFIETDPAGGSAGCSCR
jgi:hypothetical protein